MAARSGNSNWTAQNKTPETALIWAHAARKEIIKDRANTTQKWSGKSMRFGLHFCDVIHDNNKIYGDGFNTSKPLRERAQANGTLLTETVREKMSDAPDSDFRFFGALSFKNLPQAVSNYEVIFADPSPVIRNSESDLPSIAVLPFHNLTKNDEYDYFAEGVIDDIIFSLSGLKELHVIAVAPQSHLPNKL